MPTLFNRGRTGLGLFPGVERLVGDRDSDDYAALAGLSWDAVIDVCGFVPRHVERALAALEDRFGRYVFISTGMVYDHLQVQDEITESSLRLPPHQGPEHLDDDTYGSMKVACKTSSSRVSAIGSASCGPGGWSAPTKRPSSSPTGCDMSPARVLSRSPNGWIGRFR